MFYVPVSFLFFEMCTDIFRSLPKAFACAAMLLRSNIAVDIIMTSEESQAEI